MPTPSSALDPYDGVLLVSFGGPESPEEVIPFLERVTAGKGVPRERLEVVAEHYLARGGVSPINAENRRLKAALEAELAGRGIVIPVLWGNRNSDPFLVAALHDALDRGLTALLVVLTSAYSSYSSCRQYRENLADALAAVGPAADGLVLDKIRPYALTPALAGPWTRAVAAALRDDPTAYLLGVTHSIPEAMNDTSGPGDGDGGLYVEQHLRLLDAVASAVAEESGHRPAPELVFCSRSGPPHQPWLEPDVNDRLRELAAQGVRHVLLAPIGFVSDHMEVIQDLDTEAAATAASVGLRLTRLPTPGSDPAFARGLVDLCEERAAQTRGELLLPARVDDGDLRPAHCAAGCCPNLREVRDALCGEAP